MSIVGPGQGDSQKMWESVGFQNELADALVDHVEILDLLVVVAHKIGAAVVQGVVESAGAVTANSGIGSEVQHEKVRRAKLVVVEC